MLAYRVVCTESEITILTESEGTMMFNLLIGDTVRWANPLSDESDDTRYVVTEVNGDRCFIRLVCDMAIAPVTLARCADLLVVTDTI
jgi:hypothetical protein